MPRLRRLQSSFNAGELNPKLAARTDVSRYFSGAEALREVLTEPLGGVRRRPGQRFRFTVADAGVGWRLVEFAFNTEQTYLMVFTDSKIRVYIDDQLQATVTAPWTGAQCEQINWCQSADTLIVFHPDVQPQKLVRGGSHTVWTLSAITFANIPTYDFGAGAEAVISATRGWPRCGTFHEARLWLGGLKSRPATILGSKSGSYFDLNKGTSLDDEGVNFTIDSDQVNAIYALRAGRHLQVFTSGAELAVIVSGPITPKNFAFKEQTRLGSEPWVRPIEIEGATLFVQRGGKALREYLYADVSAAYESTLISLLASHLIQTPVDLAVRKSSSDDDVSYVLMVNTDGSIAVLNTLRSQQITAFTRLATDGDYRHVAVVGGEVWLGIRRTINGADSYSVEKWDEDCLTDAAVRLTGAQGPTITGLGHLEGKTVDVLLDGAVQTPKVVSGGQVTLSRASTASVEIGLPFRAVIRTMAIEGQLPDGTMVGKQARVVGVTLRLHETGPIVCNGNRPAFRKLGPAGVGPLDQPVEPFTGDKEINGLQGWSGRAQVEITQEVPAPLTLLGIAQRVSV